MEKTPPQTQRTTPEQITTDVLASFDGCGDDRLREIMQALVRHLHGFVSEVKLTPAEWTRAIETLTRTGHITDQHRQEFVLWSDSLGASMLVDALENTLPAGATESTVLGPFYVPGSPLREYGASIAEEGDAGVPALVHGHVRDTRGAPIASTRCSVRRHRRTISAAASGRARTAAMPSWRSDRCRTRFPTTGRWGRCWS